MGISYDGCYGYGVHYSADDGEGWPEKMLQAVFHLTEDECPNQHMHENGIGFDFEEWLDLELKVGTYSDYSNYGAFAAERKRRCVQKFGCMLTCSYVGYIDYATWVVHPEGAWWSECTLGRVPETSDDDVATWHLALQKLRKILPGGDEPGWLFGCSVG